MTLRELTYQVSFNTPAFLGNAEQQAQWRTPPFKALLRQWWRVVKAPSVGYDHSQLLARENELFGSAGDNFGGGRSKVQLRLSAWDEGAMSALQPMARHPHPEVKDRDRQPIDIGTAIYLGFGPVTLQGMRKAIAPAATPLTFKVHCPETELPDIKKVMQLVAWFGTFALMPVGYTSHRSVQVSGFDEFGHLTPIRRLISASCSSGQRFAIRLPSDSQSPAKPLPSANSSPCRASRGLSPPSRCALPGAPQKSPPPWQESGSRPGRNQLLVVC